jgi:hypothetical protein
MGFWKAIAKGVIRESTIMAAVRVGSQVGRAFGRKLADKIYSEGEMIGTGCLKDLSEQCSCDDCTYDREISKRKKKKRGKIS